MDIYRILSDFITANSGMCYNVTEDRDTELRDMLTTGAIQFALTPFVNQYPGANHILWCHDSFVLMCPSSHPYARLSSIEITQLKEEQMLIHGMPVDYTNFFATCEEFGFRPKVKTVSFNSAIAMLVEQQQELAVVNEEGLSSINCSNVVIVPIVPESGYDIHLIFNDEQKMTQAGRAFLSFFTSHRENYFPSECSKP